MTLTTTTNYRIFHRRTLCEALADSIRARLFAHEFPPGAPLDENALSACYGVGHLPVSKALERLALERLLAKRPQGGYDIFPLARVDLENLLDTLAKIRGLALLQRMKNGRNVGLVAVEMPLPSRPYWGPAGLAVARPFALAAQSLYNQLRLCIGPALSEIEADGAQRCGEAMTRAIASGAPETLEAFCRESARDFRQRALEVFDAAIHARENTASGLVRA